MSQQRLPMRKVRDVLRLKAVGLGKRKIAASLGISATAVGMRGMMNLLGPCPYIIFKVVPDYALAPHFPLLEYPPAPATCEEETKYNDLIARGVATDIIARPWKRAGYPDFSLLAMRPV